jgi:hypothetical protein
MRSVGLWPTARHLLAVGLDERGRAARPLVAMRSALARQAMLDFFASLPVLDVVLAETVLGADLTPESFADVLHAHNRTVWIAPAALAEATCAAAGQRASPRNLAAILARLPAIPRLRRELRRLTRSPVQLDLLSHPTPAPHRD